MAYPPVVQHRTGLVQFQARASNSPPERRILNIGVMTRWAQRAPILVSTKGRPAWGANIPGRENPASWEKAPVRKRSADRKGSNSASREAPDPQGVQLSRSFLLVNS